MTKKKYTPEMVELAKKYIQLTKLPQAFDWTESKEKQRFESELIENNPKFKQNQIDEISIAYVDAFSRAMKYYALDWMLEDVLGRFTYSELLVSVEFYETEVGQSVIKKSAELIEKFIPECDRLVNFTSKIAEDKTWSEMKMRGIKYKL